MRDVLGWRRKFGVLVPSTNTVVEPDYARMAVPGVTAHVSRIHVRDQSLGDDSDMQRMMIRIREEIGHAVERVMTAEVDHLVLGMSDEMLWGGLDGQRAWTRDLEVRTGLGVTSGAAACDRALQLYGARRIGVVTPYQPIGDASARRFFTELGYHVERIHGLRCPSAVAIARVGEDELRAALRAVDGDDIDAIVQCGTNLSMVRLADEAERWLGKPVIAVNAATWWHALRTSGVDDRLHGFGGLLRER